MSAVLAAILARHDLGHPDAKLLAELLVLWRDTRSTRLADAIQRLGVDDGLPKTLAVVAKQDTVGEFVERAKSLESIDDPRLTVAIIGWLETARWAGSSAAPGWEHLFARLIALADVRAIPALRRAERDPPPFLGAKHTKWIVTKCGETADALEAKARPEEVQGIEAVEALSSEPARDLFPRKRGGAKESALAIVQRVFDAPDDDDVRRVAADALLDASEPWGELISLQYSLLDKEEPAARARVNELLNRHGTDFCGPIAKIAKKASRKFERGFLHELATDASMVQRRDWESAASAPHWSTVRRVQVDTSSTPKWWLPVWLANPCTRRLLDIALTVHTRPQFVLTRSHARAAWRVIQAVDIPAYLKWFAALVAALPPEERNLEIATDEAREQLRAILR